MNHYPCYGCGETVEGHNLCSNCFLKIPRKELDQILAYYHRCECKNGDWRIYLRWLEAWGQIIQIDHMADTLLPKLER